MRKNLHLGFLLLMAAVGFSCCSGSDGMDLLSMTDNGAEGVEVPEILLSQEPLWTANRDFGYLDTSAYMTTEGNTLLWHDNLGRLTTIVLYIPATMDVSELYQNPSSVSQLNGKYFQLGSDNELRLCDEIRSEEVQNDFNTSGMASGCEYYEQYYKGLKVFGAGYAVNYYMTPKGKRLASATGRLLTDLSVDTNPLISEKQAKRIFGARLGDKVTKDWEAELMVREYCIKTGDKDELDERLIWHVKGTLYPEEEAFMITSLSSTAVKGPLRHEAQIDAHTGQLLIEGHSLSLSY